MSSPSASDWWLLVISLPSRSATARMRVWRGLKALGAAVLRDGVYILPAADNTALTLEEQARAVRRAGGSASVLPLNGLSTAQEEDFRALFDRSADYARLTHALTRVRTGLTPRRAKSMQSRLKQLRREFETIRGTDYFAGPAADHTGQLLEEAETATTVALSPGEPRAEDGVIRRLDPKEYRGRSWATRTRPWVDRLASAWLIRRFIDRKAKFIWLKDPTRCPRSAIGFDFDGARFTHVGTRVTFEVLLASFGLDDDPALRHIGQLVHFLDVGGVPPAEARGLEVILRGAREHCLDDDALVVEAGKIFNYLYQTYQHVPPER